MRVNSLEMAGLTTRGRADNDDVQIVRDQILPKVTL